MAYIYKITNLKNGKCYIGQTQSTIFRRFQRHIEDAKNGSDTHFHRALRKYPITNWIFQIIEEVPPEELDEKEKYYIKLYDSINNGYNITSGGQNKKASDINRKLTDNQIIEIQERLKNTFDSFTDIGNDYGVSFSCISDINTGRTWKKEQYNYPIRPRNERSMSYENFLLVIKMLQTHLFSAQKIGKILNLGGTVIGKINNGKYTKFKYPNNITIFPIHDYKDISICSDSKVNLEKVVEILLDYLYSNGTNNYSSKWKDVMTPPHYRDIIKGKCPKYIHRFLKTPLLDNKEENIKILNEILDTYKKYA